MRNGSWNQQDRPLPRFGAKGDFLTPWNQPQRQLLTREEEGWRSDPQETREQSVTDSVDESDLDEQDLLEYAERAPDLCVGDNDVMEWGTRGRLDATE